MTTLFITGISRGLGRALATAALGRGHTVVGTTRTGTIDQLHDEPLHDERLHVVALELTDPAGPALAVAEAVDRAGPLDVVVNNAGYGLLGPVEESDATEIQRVFEVNVLGPLRVIQASLPHLRARRHGHLALISSIAALDPLPGSGIYAAAKSALSGLGDALAGEVAPFGIGVTVIEPGAFRTDFLSTHSVRHTAATIDDYAAFHRTNRDHFSTHHGHQPGNPDRAAQVVLDAIAAPNPPRHLVLGTDAMTRTRRRVGELLADLDTWAEASTTTAFPDTAEQDTE